LGVTEGEGLDHIHGLVEATKRAFLVRDRYVTDPAYMTREASEFLDPAFLDSEAAKIDRARALPWPQLAAPGDTIWMGAIDGGPVFCGRTAASASRWIRPRPTR
jgi:gamma-glutamyltranspeptidase/glutathione hydrolase